MAAGATITHDANGNLSGDGVWTYTYDTDNRLKSANKTGLAATLAYDAEGRLRQTVIAGGTTNLAYDGVDLVAEYDSAGTLLRRYVHGPGVDEPLVGYEGTGTANKSWLYADHLGSVVATANSAGTSTATYTYGPYGEPNVTTGSRFRYTGQQLIGQLNLYYYKARFYSPAIGRFLQTDPIGYEGGMNLYAYVKNNPLNFTDPTGLYWFQQDWQAADPIVGREGTFIYPGGPISSFIEKYVPAGRTLGELHDPLNGALRSAGVPDWLANIPTMLPTYVVGIGVEVLRTFGILEQPQPTAPTAPYNFGDPASQIMWSDDGK